MAGSSQRCSHKKAACGRCNSGISVPAVSVLSF